MMWLGARRCSRTTKTAQSPAKVSGDNVVAYSLAEIEVQDSQINHSPLPQRS